jgi:ActR/RegA family two-component response regulator
MPPSRVLLVDDDPAIRTSLDEILRKEGFDVTVCATVAESLSEINSKSFDALISDLNIGEPSDGFTVVSAMRRTQPRAITLIMTGFPAFDSALEAIRQQVDAYLLKPTDVRELVGLLRRGLTEHRGKHIPLPRRRLYEVVRERIDDAIQQWTVAMRKMNRPPWSNLTDDEMIDGLRVLLAELCYRVESPDAEIRQESLRSARAHGSLRAQQHYCVPDLMVEARNLRLVLLNVVHEHLIELNLSNVFTDLFTMSDTLDEMAMASVQAFLADRPKS